MKINEFIKQLNNSTEFVEDQTTASAAQIAVRDADGSTVIGVYIGDGERQHDYQYMTAEDLRQVAKLFKKLAEKLEARDAG